MNIGEDPIQEPQRYRKGLRSGPRPLVIIAATGWLAVSSFPPPAVAQADHSGPAVVPPAEAYLGDPDAIAQPPLLRWRTGDAAPRTLWVHLADPPPQRPGFWEETIRAMDVWNAVGGIPLTFRQTEHPLSADVEFRWIRRFAAHQAGTTDWETDGDGWLRSAVVTLAMEHEEGIPMSSEFLRMVALHELGHVLGLPHSGDPKDVMHPGNRNLSLSDRDIRSVRRLYEDLASAKVSGP